MLKEFFLPRIVLTVNDDRMPFIFKRKQFPTKVCYAMTINKSQGESLKKIGVYLPEPIFGHGQLYVALSRATSLDGLKMVIAQQLNQPANTTKNIVYKAFLNKINLTQVSSLFFHIHILYAHYSSIHFLILDFHLQVLFLMSTAIYVAILYLVFVNIFHS